MNKIKQAYEDCKKEGENHGGLFTEITDYVELLEKRIEFLENLKENEK